MAVLDLFAQSGAGDTDELDAYSRTVSDVAERLIPSVASLRVGRSEGRRSQGSGSGVAITADGFLVTSAHVVAGTTRGSASFSDGIAQRWRETSGIYGCRADLSPSLRV